MSVEIDWSLLASSSGSDLAQSLVSKLNAQLETAKRPSFLGPITVTDLEFGTIGPDVEIKDVGDVWHAFEGDDDDEADDDDATTRTHGGDRDEGDEVNGRGRSSSTALATADDDWEHVRRSASSRPHQRHGSFYHGSNMDDETGSVLSEILSPRVSLNRLGAGIGIGSGMGINLAGSSGISGAMSPAFAPSVISSSRSQRAGGGRNMLGNNNSRARNQYLRYFTNQHLHAARPGGQMPRINSQDHTHTPPMTVYADAPHDVPLDPPAPQPLPSLQLTVHISHTPDIRLTILTSLQINYPSKLFMTLPLKLSITGFALNADVVIAFDGSKRRVHLSIVDEYDPYLPSPALTTSHSVVASPSPEPASIPTTPGATLSPLQGGGARTPASATPMAPFHPVYPTEPIKPIGQRLLPSLQIESEIGHSDAHVLRNVGKVEKFILDVLRKTIVDELVFPNYHSIII